MLMFDCFRKLLKTYHPIDPAIATSLEVNVTTSNAERFSRGSTTFPDLRTLPEPQPQKTETIRVLPNRAAKILPSVEEQPRPSGHLEIVDLEGSSPVVWGSDRNGSWETEHTSQTRASTKFSTVFPDLAPQQGNNGFVSDQALKIPTNTPEMSIPRGRSQSHGTTIINSSARITTPLAVTFTPIKNEPRSLRTVSSTPTRRAQNRKGNSLIQDNTVHMLTPRTKRRKLDEDGIVQQPQEEYGLDVIQSTRQQLKRIESCLLSQEIFWQEKRRDRELQAEAKRLADAKREKRIEGKERHILRGAQRVNRNKSRRHGSNVNYNSAITVSATEAFRHASNTEHIRPEQVQNAAGTLHSASAKPMSGQVQVEARSGISLLSERQQREQAASDKFTVAHALDRDNGEVSKSSLVLSTGKVPEGQNSSQAKDGPSTPSQAQGVAGPTFKRPMTTSSAGLSTADRVRIQKQRDHGGRSKREATVSNTKNTRYLSGRPWVYAHSKREVIMNHLRRPCVCDLLHPYFLQARWFEPKLEAFPGCKAEFLAHAEQIVHCDAHSRQLRHFCRLLLEKEDSTNSVGTQFGFR
jgi:hypothetical protein